MQSIKALIRDKVLVEPLPMDTTTDSGIFITESVAKNKFRGTVLMIGSKVQFLKVGMVVQYYDHCGTVVEHEGKECLVLKEKDDIIAKV